MAMSGVLRRRHLRRRKRLTVATTTAGRSRTPSFDDVKTCGVRPPVCSWPRRILGCHGVGDGMPTEAPTKPDTALGGDDGYGNSHGDSYGYGYAHGGRRRLRS